MCWRGQNLLVYVKSFESFPVLFVQADSTTLFHSVKQFNLI